MHRQHPAQERERERETTKRVDGCQLPSPMNYITLQIICAEWWPMWGEDCTPVSINPDRSRCLRGQQSSHGAAAVPPRAYVCVEHALASCVTILLIICRLAPHTHRPSSPCRAGETELRRNNTAIRIVVVDKFFLIDLIFDLGNEWLLSPSHVSPWLEIVHALGNRDHCVDDSFDQKTTCKEKTYLVF